MKTSRPLIKLLCVCMCMCVCVHECVFVGSCLATKVFIGNLSAMGRGRVIIKYRPVITELLAIKVIALYLQYDHCLYCHAFLMNHLI